MNHAELEFTTFIHCELRRSDTWKTQDTNLSCELHFETHNAKENVFN